MSNKVEATYHPNGHPMPVTREARHLSGVDRGKHVHLTVPRIRHSPWELAGELISTRHWGDGTVDLIVQRDTGPRLAENLPPDTIVTIVTINGINNIRDNSGEATCLLHPSPQR